MNTLFLWAHRGASGFAPENTLAAFRLAERLGAPALELDVHLTADGVPVVLHDDSLDRTTDGRGQVQRLSLAAVRAVDAGRWFAPAFAGERVPTLEEVLAWVGDRLRLNIEIKTGAAAEAILPLLRCYPAVRVLISSFQHDVLAGLRQLQPQIPLGFLTDSRLWRRALTRAADAGAESFHPNVDRVSPRLVAAAREAGLKVHPYTVDDAVTALRLQQWGCAGIFTNRLFPAAPVRAGEGVVYALG